MKPEQHDSHCDAFDKHLWKSWPPSEDIYKPLADELRRTAAKWEAANVPRYVICHSDTIAPEFLRTPPGDWVDLPKATIFNADTRDAYGEHASGFWMAYERAEELDRT